MNRDEVVASFKYRRRGRTNLWILEEMRIWSIKRELKNDELGTVSFLAQYEREVTVWNMTALRNHEEVLRKLWVFAREANLNPEEVKYSLLLCKYDSGNTLWHRAAVRGSLQALETLWSWSKEARINPVKNENKLLLARNKFGKTPRDIGVTKGREKLSEIVKEAKVNLRTLICCF